MGGVGHTGGLTNPRPWRGRCRAGSCNTGGPPLPQKRAPLQKGNKTIYSSTLYNNNFICFNIYPFLSLTLAELSFLLIPNHFA